MSRHLTSNKNKKTPKTRAHRSSTSQSSKTKTTTKTPAAPQHPANTKKKRAPPFNSATFLFSSLFLLRSLLDSRLHAALQHRLADYCNYPLRVLLPSRSPCPCPSSEMLLPLAFLYGGGGGGGGGGASSPAPPRHWPIGHWGGGISIWMILYAIRPRRRPTEAPRRAKSKKQKRKKARSLFCPLSKHRPQLSNQQGQGAT